MNKLKKHNVAIPKFWNQKYLENTTGWDIGGPTPAFIQWSKNLSTKNNNILIPGCGNGHDAVYLSQLNQNIYALDFAKEPIKNIQDIAKKKNLIINTICSDFFKLDKSYYNMFDYILEYTFYCAIPITKRLDYIKIMHKLLKTKGKLIGFFIPINSTQENHGPPFNVEIDSTIELFSQYFIIDKLEKSPYSIPQRVDNEIFFSFIKNILE